jgi:3'(2'), 5'-bisphosphate nucleotidase
MDYRPLLKLAIEAAIEAGQEILKVYQTDFFVETKNDNTPVTLADKGASDIIIKKLSETNIPIISEEEDAPDYEIRKNWVRFWMTDPLDGTKEFVKRNGEFTVNIALIENNQPVIGVIFSPVTKELFFAAVNLGSFKVNGDVVGSEMTVDHPNISERLIILGAKLPDKQLPKKYTVVASRSHLSRDLNQHIDSLKNLYGDIEIINVGSSIKQCWVAEGKAHEYMRLGITMEWDTAAGQCILEQSGCHLLDLETKLPMRYNKASLKNNYFVAKH